MSVQFSVPRNFSEQIVGCQEPTSSRNILYTGKMEGALRVRLEMRNNQLNLAIESTTEQIATATSQGITVEDAEVQLSKLQVAIDSHEAEIKYYIDKAGDQASSDLIKTYMEHQVSAEGLVQTLQEFLKRQGKPKTESDNNEPKRTCPSKLPKLDMPKFNGDMLKWHGFWDRFTSSISRQDLEDADKLTYLLSALEGPAADMVDGLEVTHANYVIAVDALKRRYGNKNMLIDAHYEALQKLDRAPYTATACRLVLNCIERHLRVLESLGENIDGHHLRSIIMSKLPNEILYELNLRSSNEVKTIRTDLERIVMAMERSVSTPVPSTSKAEVHESSTTEALHVQTESTEPHSQSYRNPRSRGTRQPQSYGNRSSRFRSRPSSCTLVSRQENQRGIKRRRMMESPTKAKISRKSCAFCDDRHFSDQCDKYMTVELRQKQLAGTAKCYRCLKKGHIAKDCVNREDCRYCKGKHNRALCLKKFPKKGEQTTMKDSCSSQCMSANLQFSCLQTATTKIRNNENGREERCRLLMDSGSQRSYITKRLATMLELRVDSEDLLTIFTFGSEQPKETKSPSAEVILRTKRGTHKLIRVNIVPHITNRIPLPPFDNIPADIIADDDSIGLGVDLLIGNDYYYSFMKNEIKKIGKDLFLVNTEFGWVFSGNMEIGHEENTLSVATYCHCYVPECQYYIEPDLPLRNLDLKFLWALESVGIVDNFKATREEEAIKHFNHSVQYDGSRYQVKWPWIQYPPELPTNFGLAYGRLKGLLNRIDKQTMEDYNAILQEQLKANVIEVVEPNVITDQQTVPPIHYLSHHMVRQEGKRGRIVCDASARVKGQKSLNECLYKGPSMLGDLTALLLKFRTHKVGIVADVEKAFLQLGLQEADREVTRFLWVKDVNQPLSNDNLLHLRFCRVPFGVISSPFLLTATIRYHMAQTDQELLTELADRCYVDNLVTGKNSSPEACELFSKTRKIFQNLSMNIREWNSNDPEFLKRVPPEQRAEKSDCTKVLGLMWRTCEDTLHLKMNDRILELNQDEVRNKREVLSVVASFYDPCGFASPLVLPAKLLLQQMCERKLKWDEPLPEDLKESWNSVVTNLRNARDIEIPRYIGLAEETEAATRAIHCYVDASKNAYSAVVYLRTREKGQTRVAFVMSKSRLIPVEDRKALRIPRWELMACVIGSRLIKYTRESLGLHIDKEYLWTDSLVVLNWMKSNKLLAPFVTRRIDEIKQNKTLEMCYIKTDDNPADIATRPDQWHRKRKLWYEGPRYLSQGEELWPENMFLIKQDSTLVAGEDLELGNPEAMDVDDEQHIVETSKQADDANVNAEAQDISIDSQSNYEVTQIKKLQLEFYPDEVSGKKTHLSRNLGLFLDVDGLLRCKGRMTNTTWTYDTKHPVLVPRNCEYTEKLIKETHEKGYHVGVSHTLSLIRQRFWIPKGRSEVQKILRKCPQCVKHGGGPYKLPPTPALPTYRVNYSSPFTYTGVDYFGPLYINSEKGKEKRWVCLYTCLAVRAIHMELVKDLTAEECLLALRRFASSRGSPSLIVSDNALYFKLSSEVLASSFCEGNKIRWKFIPQLAPWHGGFYERLVGLVKHCMKRTLEKHLLRESQLLTVIKEIESVINTRPLTTVGSYLEHTLKPSDFLMLGNSLNVNITEDAKCQDGTLTKQSLVEGWKRGQAVVNEFKKMFVKIYLLNLRERYNVSPKQPRVTSARSPCVGDVVQIKDDSKNRENWRVGKITSLLRGHDGECRVARVDVEGREFIRSIGHLYPLEAEVVDLASYEPEVLVTPNVDEPVQLAPRDGQDVMEPAIEYLKETTLPESDSSAQRGVQTFDTLLGPEPADYLKPVETVPEVEMNNHEELPSTDVDMLENPAEIAMSEDSPELDSNERPRRGAAERARRMIAEWTRHLMIVLEDKV